MRQVAPSKDSCAEGVTPTQKRIMFSVLFIFTEILKEQWKEQDNS